MLPSESSLCTRAPHPPAHRPVGSAAEREGRRARRNVGIGAATVHHPDGAAVVVDRDPVQRSPLVPLRELAPGSGAAVRARQGVGGRAVPFPRRGRASRDQPENQGQTPFILYREQDQLTHGSFHRVGPGCVNLIVSETNRQQQENWEDTRGAQNGSLLSGSDMKDYAKERARAIRRANRMRARVIKAFLRMARGALAKAAHAASVRFYEAAGVKIGL